MEAATVLLFFFFKANVTLKKIFLKKRLTVWGHRSVSQNGPAADPDDLTSIPRTHTGKGEKLSAMTSAHAQVPTHVKLIQFKNKEMWEKI